LVAYPDLSIDLDERPSIEIALAIAEGRADLGVVADIADLAALQTRVIAQDQLVVVVSETHRISDQRSIAFADVLGEPFVGLSDAALEAHLGERAARLGRQIYYRIQLRRIEHVAMLVESGVGIAILSEASTKDLGHLGLAIVPLRDPPGRLGSFIFVRVISLRSRRTRACSHNSLWSRRSLSLKRYDRRRPLRGL
jgi:DNA-binding transcriptional LysR family regulator